MFLFGCCQSCAIHLYVQSRQELSPEEKARQEKVRATARDRQRKHRALVKEQKLRELGLDMGNKISDVQYREGQYQQVLEHELQHNPHGVLLRHELPFPQGQQQGGATFASTLLARREKSTIA